MPWICTGSYDAWKWREHGRLCKAWKDPDNKIKYTGFDEFAWYTFRAMTTRADSDEDDKPQDQSGDESGYESNDADMEPRPSPAKKISKKKNVSKPVNDHATSNTRPE